MHYINWVTNLSEFLILLDKICYAAHVQPCQKGPPGRLHVFTQCVPEERQLSNELADQI